MGTILTVSRNNLHLTKKAVASFLRQDTPCDVLVVDNNSSDGTVPWLRTKSLAICALTNQESLAYCWNTGMALLMKGRAEEILVTNNDVVLRWDTYRLLQSCNLPFVTCVSVDSLSQLGESGDRGTKDLLASRRAHPDFSCFMIRREVLDKVGLFDKSYYPAYCEDNDYHIRMHRAGIEACCVDLPFLHIGAATVRSAARGEAERIGRLAAKNRERFKRKFGCLPGTPEYYSLFS
jgi:O-antigen biosynthesis protein